MHCPSCGQKVDPAAAFCSSCGAPSYASGDQTVVETAPADDALRSFVDGRYVATRFLGAGASKRVYLAHDTLIDRDVAFASIKIEGLDVTHRQRILREARTMGRLGDHPNIVLLYDLGEEGDDHLFMVLPVMEGGTVEDVIRESPGGRVPLDRAIAIARDVCRGLEYAHAKDVVHRDLKPSNVWLTADQTAKIGDFGLAMSMDMSRLTQSGTVVGTLLYMSPEQATGGKITPRSDLYSLGCMLYEMVCGRPPFVGDDPKSHVAQVLNSTPDQPSRHNPECPHEIETLIMRLLAKDPADRYGSATEVLAVLGTDDSAPAATETPRNNLPSQLTSFIGREHEIAEVKRLLGATRLLTLTGAGGCGKSRLALQVASEVLDDYPDGVWLVELAALGEPSLVTQQVASVVGVQEEPGEALLTTLTNFLKSRKMLVVLDNCEHLIQTCAELANTLLKACPDLRILSTSREPLGISGETTWRVPSMSLPDLEHLPDLESLTQYEAVRLFIDRARSVSPRFEVTNENAPSVAQVCHRLDGIPLAIELAAVRVRMLSAEQINERVEDRFRLLTGGSRSALPRQQTLRALVDWSYDLLSESEQVLFSRLSVFAGGFTLDAAEAVCADGDVETDDVLDLLSGLVDKSLVTTERVPEGPARYQMLETLRHYGLEHLSARREDEEATRDRYTAYFQSLLREADEAGRPGWEKWSSRLEQEHDNLRAVLQVSLEGHDVDLGLGTARLMYSFWDARGHWSEGREWLAKFLDLPEASRRTESRAKALQAAGDLAMFQYDRESAWRLLEESLDIFRELGNRAGEAYDLESMAYLSKVFGDFEAACRLAEDSLAILREIGDKKRIANSLYLLGQVHHMQSDDEAARTYYEEALEAHKEAGNRQGVAYALNNLGLLAYYVGDLSTARARYEESLAISRELGDTHTMVMWIQNLGGVSLAEGDHAKARSYFEQGLNLSREQGFKNLIASSLRALGSVSIHEGDHETAALYCEESLSISRELKDRPQIAAALVDLGNIAQYQGDYLVARDLCEQGHAIYRELGDRGGVSLSLINFGEIAYTLDEYGAARSYFEEALTIGQELGEKHTVNGALDGFASLAVAESQPGRAITLAGAAAALRDAINYSLPPPEQARMDRILDPAHQKLGEDAYQAAWSEGQKMSVDEAVTYALQEAGPEDRG